MNMLSWDTPTTIEDSTPIVLIRSLCDALCVSFCFDIIVLAFKWAILDSSYPFRECSGQSIC